MSILNFNEKNPLEVQRVQENLSLYISHYFNHYPWVCFYNSYNKSFHIQNLYVSFEYGMSTKPIYLYKTIKDFHKDIMKKCGELLDRASLPAHANINDIDIWLAVTERNLIKRDYSINNLDKSI